MHQVLTIAGSDSGGGAGIQADLKSFSAAGTYGTSVITSVTAQNTKGVTDIYDLPLSIIEAQLDAVFQDFDIKCVKTGMLSNMETINLVSDKLQEYNANNLVVDPVMVAKGGAKLLKDDAVKSMTDTLIPTAGLITPNIEEAEHILGNNIFDIDTMKSSAGELLKLGCDYVLLKGGHLKDDKAVDVLVGSDFETEFESDRFITKNTHGTGCTYASSIAAYLSKGYNIKDAVEISKEYITGAIKSSADKQIGSGHGPLNHFYFTEGFRKR